MSPQGNQRASTAPVARRLPNDGNAAAPHRDRSSIGVGAPCRIANRIGGPDGRQSGRLETHDPDNGFGSDQTCDYACVPNARRRDGRREDR